MSMKDKRSCKESDKLKGLTAKEFCESMNIIAHNVSLLPFRIPSGENVQLECCNGVWNKVKSDIDAKNIRKRLAKKDCVVLGRIEPPPVFVSKVYYSDKKDSL